VKTHLHQTILLATAVLGLSMSACSFALCERANGPQKIAVFYDGTWNDIGTNTNVLRLKEEVEATAGASHRVRVLYDPGIGSDGRKLTGGSLGYGFARNARDGYRFVSECYEPGDQIYIFGFSRGAFTARTLAAMIQQVGILNRNAFMDTRRDGTRELDESAFRNGVEEAFKITKDAGKEAHFKRTRSRLWTLNDLWRWISVEGAMARLKSSRQKSNPDIGVVHPPSIEVVGVWDTVAALGSSHDDEELLYRVRLEDMSALRRAYHALSIDEARPSFRPVSWTESGSVAPNQILEEVWFPGAHSDVGGGYLGSDVAFGTANLADLSLHWMVSALCADGLVRPGFAHLTKGQRLALASAARHVETQPLTKGSFVRVPKENAVIHASVRDRMVAAEEMIAEATEKRAYRPRNLLSKDDALRAGLTVLEWDAEPSACIPSSTANTGG
jgi:uncharacterized protein (DUF2235 family)